MRLLRKPGGLYRPKNQKPLSKSKKATEYNPLLLTTYFVDTFPLLHKLIYNLTKLPTHKTSLYVGCHSSRFSGSASISILTLFMPTRKQIFFLDLHTMGKAGLKARRKKGASVRTFLESDTFQKGLFDVRHTSHLLYVCFGITLRGALDIQLMELAQRRSKSTHPPGSLRKLNDCIQTDTPISRPGKMNFQAIYEAAAKLFDKTLGGSSQVFQERPLREDLKVFCEQNLEPLPYLHKSYMDRVTRLGKEEWVATKTAKRLQESQSAEYLTPSTFSSWPDRKLRDRLIRYPQLVKARQFSDRESLDSNPAIKFEGTRSATRTSINAREKLPSLIQDKIPS